MRAESERETCSPDTGMRVQNNEDYRQGDDMGKQYIKIRGASEHNLKNVSLNIPREELVVLTGLSGSGKSSLAFDTIYAEGQRRYMESLSSYARMFLGRMEKPNVESIEGLSPSISIDQKSTNRNPRSTVGTVTEIYDYMRLLYARIGIPHCPNCGKPIMKQSIDQMVDQVLKLPEKTRIQLLAPVVRGKKGRHEKILAQAKKSGYVRVRVDGNLYELSEDIVLDKNIKHSIEVVVDRLVIREGIQKRLTDSLETALALTGGTAMVEVVGGEVLNFSQSFACPDCGISIEEVEPRSFSFNNPFGACPVCAGLGYKMEFSTELMIPDESLSISQGAIIAPGWASSAKEGSFTNAVLVALAEHYGFSLDTPFRDYPERIRDILINGTGGEEIKVRYRSQRGEGVYDVAFEGLIENENRRYRETFSDSMKAEYETFMRFSPCTECGGKRLKKSSLAVTVGIPDVPGPPGTLGDAADDRRADPEGDPEQGDLPDRRGPGLPDIVPGHRIPVRRGSPAYPAGDPDRVGTGGCRLHPGRAQHRPPPERQ